jgi:hypothetical protein
MPSILSVKQLRIIKRLYDDDEDDEEDDGSGHDDDDDDDDDNLKMIQIMLLNPKIISPSQSL